jgi:ABC-type Mn2+/Zn2+ transport system ATPase subunit
MKLVRMELRNFACFDNFDLLVDGRSLIVIGPNGGGKTSLLGAMRRALKGGSIDRREFRDPAREVEVIATVTGIPPALQGVFADVMDFSNAPPTLRIGVRATWDPSELRVESVHGYPDAGWRAARSESRDSLAVISLPAWRDPSRLASMTGRQSVLSELIRALPLETELADAVSEITDASRDLASTVPMQDLLEQLRVHLSGLLPKVQNDAFALGLDVTEPQEVLDQFELLVAYRGPETPLPQQSGGIAQVSVFTLALELLQKHPQALLLVDEPENALHPHAQRALVARIHQVAGQSVIATHSAAVLDRVDPRLVTRLRRSPEGTIEAVRAQGLSEQNARTVRRYATSQTAESYFSEVAILVEGFSDLLAVRVLAPLLNIALDANGVSVISLEGADLFKHYLELLGPSGLDLELRGLVDLDHEAAWIQRLTAAGIVVTDRTTLNAAGFQVCDPDLEAELVAPLSAQEIETVFDADGALSEFQDYSGQPSQAGLSTSEIQLRFIKKDKIRWAPLIAEAISAAAVPLPIRNLLSDL